MKKLTQKIVTVALAVLLTLTLSFSCSKEEEQCTAVIENSGIIVNTVDIADCSTPFYIGNFVIDSSTELDSVLQLNSSCQKPEIDFTQYTLLGRYAYAQCTGSYLREVTKDTTNKRYNFTITVESCGSCDCLSQNMNWVLVPKLPENYTVRFTVK
jgi:hypothetical protein